MGGPVGRASEGWVDSSQYDSDAGVCVSPEPEPALVCESTVEVYSGDGPSSKSPPPEEAVCRPSEPPTSSLDCIDAWKQVDGEADAILNKSKGPIQRNEDINATYAKMYLEDPKLEWMGAAAFASKQVGCGIKDADELLIVADMDRHSGNWEGPNLMIEMQGALAEPVYDALSNGNKAVFKDIYPAHLFYQRHGLEMLEQCADERQTPLDKKVLDGFSDIDAGHSDTGAMKILQHEQMDVLQARDVLGNEKVSGVMEMNQKASEYWIGRSFGAQKTSVSFTAECKGEPSVVFKGTNPADPNQRWPYAQDVVKKFHEIKDDPKTLEQLKKIADGGN